MHFCLGIEVDIIRIGRQKTSQEITFIFYKTRVLGILNWWISWLLPRNFCLKTLQNIFMTACSTAQRSTKFILLSGRLDKNVNAVLACPADSFGTLGSPWNFFTHLHIWLWAVRGARAWYYVCYKRGPWIISFHQLNSCLPFH